MIHKSDDIPDKSLGMKGIPQSQIVYVVRIVSDHASKEAVKSERAKLRRWISQARKMYAADTAFCRAKRSLLDRLESELLK